MTDKLKLGLAVLIFAGGIGAFYYLGEQPDFVRVVTILVAAALSIAVAMQTVPGRNAWEFAKGARTELRKVVWPSPKETMQVTLVVFAMVVLIAVFLWIVDWGLLKIVQSLTGQRS